jgi:ABC-type uncharacterized transport system auxiliary subunit
MTVPVEPRSPESRQCRQSWRQPVALVMVLPLMAALVLGCGKPPVLINRYILDYPPPVLVKTRPLDAGLQVQLFAVNEAINRTEMVYKESPYRTGVYWYNRWRTNPGFLATDYLTRDLRDSRLFKAVFPHDLSGPARFRLEGGVQAFNEINWPEWNAALTLTITLLDTDKENIADRVVFQRSYQTLEPMLTKTPQGLAEAMSRAMQKLSQQIIDDTYRAAKQRLATPNN